MKPLGLKLIGVAFLAAWIFLIVSVASYSPADDPAAPVYPRSEQIANLCGLPGAKASSICLNLFGLATPVLLAYLAWTTLGFLRGRPVDQIFLRTLGLFMVLTGLTGLVALNAMSFTSLKFPTGPAIGPGGYLGTTVAMHLDRHVTQTGTFLFLASVTLAGLVLGAEGFLLRFLRVLMPLEWKTHDQSQFNENPVFVESEHAKHSTAENAAENSNEIIFLEEAERGDETAEEVGVGWSFFRRKRKKNRMSEQAARSARPVVEAEPEFEAVDESEEEIPFHRPEYRLPSPTLLTEPEPFDEEQYIETVHRQAQQLEKAFADFGLQVQVVDIQTGPVISQFELKLAKGLRLNKITALSEDLAIALKVPSVRIVAPIPGKNTVGVELPNEHRQMVLLRDVIEQRSDATEKFAIPVYLGKDVSGKPMVIDLTKLPHLLIAGRTGTGKSVCLNSIIVSMLMTRSPEQVRMLMIDPKMVELSPYKTIPHLMHPVVTDMRKAEAILAWTVEKMEERYQLLASAGVRQLSEYNKLSEQELRRRMKLEDCDEAVWAAIPRKMPYMVIIADEMADLMMTAAKEVETHIIRLAQKSRAVGIHLVLATQKPTVDIITGLIKSNLPARIAFGVATRSDSQVVLDRNGAERLLGNGDMLFLQPGTSQAVRGQGTYVSDAEIEGIIETIGTEDQDFVEELVAIDPDAEESGGAAKCGKADEGDEECVQRDELYLEAVEYIIREGRGSLSLLHRKFSIGYGRAARLIDFMAEDGIVGPYNGSQAREVLMTLGDWRRQTRKTSAVRTLEPEEEDEPETPPRKRRGGGETKTRTDVPVRRGVTIKPPLAPPLVKVAREPVTPQKSRSKSYYSEPDFYEDDEFDEDDYYIVGEDDEESIL